MSRLVQLVAIGLVLFGVASVSVTAAAPRLLVFYLTLDYYHESIPTAISAITNLSDSNPTVFSPTFSKDQSLFTQAGLATYSAIAFLSNSEGLGTNDPEVLADSGKVAFVQWLQGGGNLLAFHAGTACLFRMPEFGVAIGSWFDYHPDISNATFTKLVSHPTISMLPNRLNLYEEVYSFMSDPRSVNSTVLLTVDASTYSDPKAGTRPYYQGTPHPIAWYRDTPVDLENGTDANGVKTMRGRMWMTSLGHESSTWERDDFQSHILEGIRWSLANVASSNTTTTTASPTGSSMAASASATAGTITGATSTSKSGTGSSTAANSPVPTTTRAASSGVYTIIEPAGSLIAPTLLLVGAALLGMTV
ncbi:BQ2448_3996 [Microbotryum intermedium]|uniref:BQ2448_3996 protein n=1 Tax=Microbotryum intermedium TaxID=269621 RepID=A0A238FI36_9BASI|nr:BQ2448_3996 [Microbotryum intermedium]